MNWEDATWRAPTPDDYQQDAVIRAPQPGEQGWDPIAALRSLIAEKANPQPELSNESVFPKKQYVNPLQPLTPTLTSLAEGVPVQDRSQILPELLGFLPGAGAAKGVAPVRTELSELLPVIANSMKQRRALAEAVPEYSNVVEGLGGVTENAGRMAKDYAENLWNRIKGVGPDMGGQGELAFAPAKVQEQPGLITSFAPGSDTARATIGLKGEHGREIVNSLQGDPRGIFELLRHFEKTRTPEEINNLRIGAMMPKEDIIGFANQAADRIEKKYPDLATRLRAGADMALSDAERYGLGMTPNSNIGTESAAEYRPFLHNLLGKYAVIIPHIPKSVEEPLLLKTTAPTIRDLSKSLFWRDTSPTAVGQYHPLWGSGPDQLWDHIADQVRSTGQHDLAGDVILSSTQGQEKIIPHEVGHYVDDLLTKSISRGARPNSGQREQAVRQFGSEDMAPFEDAMSEFWGRLGKSEKEQMRNAWSYGASDNSMKRELAAELVNPESLASFFRKPTRAAENLKTKASVLWPELEKYWNMVPDYIPDNAYYIPRWNIPQAAAGLPSALMPSVGQ